MVKIVPKPPAPLALVSHPKILYLGQNADEICDLVSPHIGMMAIDYVDNVQDALVAARTQERDIIIVDQRDESLANKLILPLFSALGYQFKLVVITTLSDVSSYLKVPGVARVLAAPVRASQLSRTLGLDASKLRHDKIKLAEEATKEEAAPVPRPRLSPLVYISNIGMQLVSTAYKRLAFVLLGVLFLSFTFYGTMIGFYLTSSGWGAPQTLTSGNPLVDKVQKDIGDLRLAMNLNEQRYVEAEQLLSTAARTEAEAKILVNFAEDTVEKEIISRERQVKVSNQNIRRTLKVKKTFDAQLKKGGLGDELSALYTKHLIDRKSYTSNTLGLLESGQRIAGMEEQIAIMESDKALLETQIAMLYSLREQLRQEGPMSSITASSSDLLLLTKQALDARAAYDTARAQVAVSSKTTSALLNSRAVMQAQIANFQNSTFGRAIDQRVDVVFVPYSNATRYQEGAALYTCRFTMVYCWKAGTIGKILPGEINSVHPFFGKPIRGYFIEALLTDPLAATREIIHAQRPPLFF
jgi:hypothetical protein